MKKDKHRDAWLWIAMFCLSVVFFVPRSVPGQLPPLARLRVLKDSNPLPDQTMSPSDDQLPDGAGKKIIERSCVLCHAAEMILNSGWDTRNWAGLVQRMVEFGAPIKREDVPTLIEYLNANFTNERKAPGVTVDGNVHAAITEWDLPTPNTRPHDPLYAREGFLWYTGSFANILGRFDPKTEQFKEFKLKQARSVPNGLVEDKEGNILFTAEAGGYIGKLDPKTGDVTEFALPDSSLVAHSLAIDRMGIVFFTILEARPPWHPNGSKVGRLNPKTGEIKLADTPTPRSGPYGIVINSKGIPFFTERGSSRLGSINPDTMVITEYQLPNKEIGTRRLAVGPDDTIWYTDSVRGYIGHFDPKTGKFNEWASPSGPRSFPYGINTSGNIVWYAEANTEPNMLVRFDPETQKFQSWPVRSGGGIKQISPQPDGSLWIARTGSNGIAFVKVTPK